MSVRSTAPKSKRPAAPRAIRVIDGARHWRKTIDQVIWLYRRGGIPHDDLAQELAQSLHRHRQVRSLKLPRLEELEYARILTHWRTQPGFLDEHGNARILKYARAANSFCALVRSALPGAVPAAVLNVLIQHQVVKRTRKGRLQLQARELLPRGRHQAQFLAYSLSALEGIFDTCTSNLASPDPDTRIGQLQRTVFAERFDLAHLPEYDEFLRKAAAEFLAAHDTWLKRHEIAHDRHHKGEVGYVGVGIFGFKAK